jgi:hypothetical protein
MTRHSISRGLLSAIAIATTAHAALAQGRIVAPPGGAGTVTLTRIDYDRLLELATKTRVSPNVPPVAAVLNRAEITVRIDAALARATVRIDGETYRSGITKVPLVKGATLIEARLADRALPMTAEGDTHVAMLTDPAPFSAILELGAPLTIAPGRASFTLPVPPAGSTTAIFDIPGDQTDLHLSSGLILSRTSTNGRTRVEATLVPGAATQVWWGTRDSAATTVTREARLLADVKTLVTIGDADLRLFTLLDVTVLQGTPQQIDIRIPAGYEVSSVSGASLDRTETRDDVVTLFLTASTERRYHFLIALDRQNAGGSFKLETGFVSVQGAQRETGEAAIAGTGTLQVSGPEPAGLRRIDVRELDATLASTARQSMLAAYRYQRTTEARPVLTLDVTRFPDAAVLAAIAERAVATTLVTTEGRALTEIVLTLRNHAQPFMKVTLPEGATILSVEVGGSPAKPVTGTDGSRVPLLRPGFRPVGTYTVSFVYIHAGAPFLARGDMRMALPRMDVPVGILEWEVFIPDRFRVDRFDGTALPASLVERAVGISGPGSGFGVGSGVGAGVGGGSYDASRLISPGQLGGRVVDSQGLPVPGVTIVVDGGGRRQTAITDANGLYVLSGVSSGSTSVSSAMPGFATVRRSLEFDQRPRQVDFVMTPGGITETVTVVTDAPVVGERLGSEVNGQLSAKSQPAQHADNEVSLNVQSLQRRASGVLPVRMDVPKAGTSNRFIRPLVVDEETSVSFRYRRR